jgi:hypothetical protein
MADRSRFWKRDYQWRLGLGVPLALAGVYLLVPAIRSFLPWWIFLPLLAASGVAGLYAGRALGERLSEATARKPADLQEESWSSPGGIEQMLREHMARLATLFQGRPGEREALAFLNRVLDADLLTYAVDAIHRTMPDAVAAGEIRHDTRTVADWFVAVTVCPWLLPEEIQPHMEGGYLRLINDLSGAAVNSPGGKNVIHWIYCYNGSRAAAHISLLSNPQAPSHVPTVIAQDFLTAEERRQVGLPPAG